MHKLTIIENDIYTMFLYVILNRYSPNIFNAISCFVNGRPIYSLICVCFIILECIHMANYKYNYRSALDIKVERYFMMLYYTLSLLDNCFII